MFNVWFYGQPGPHACLCAHLRPCIVLAEGPRKTPPRRPPGEGTEALLEVWTPRWRLPARRGAGSENVANTGVSPFLGFPPLVCLAPWMGFSLCAVVTHASVPRLAVLVRPSRGGRSRGRSEVSPRDRGCRVVPGALRTLRLARSKRGPKASRSGDAAALRPRL